MRTAFVHDWFVDLGGAEKVAEAIHEIYPADIYTLLYKKATLEKLGLAGEKVFQSFIRKLPFALKKYRNYLMFFPSAIERFDLSNYDLVISSSHAVAKGALTNANQLHICYCYTPIRYAWDLTHQYLKETGLDKGILSVVAHNILHKIRIWDFTTVNRVDYFIAISKYIARRIKKVYNRDSVVIYPPVDVDKFQLETKKEDFYLTASRMVPYKKIALIVESFAKMSDKKLIVIGDGPEMKKVKHAAEHHENILVIGYQKFEVLKEKMQKAKAFVFAAEEDFGIIPVEAQACGTPVIAFGRGGARETVIDGVTGVFFEEQSVESIVDTVDRFESLSFDPNKIREHAETFSKQRFQREFSSFVQEKYADFQHKFLG